MKRAQDRTDLPDGVRKPGPARYVREWTEEQIAEKSVDVYNLEVGEFIKLDEKTIHGPCVVRMGKVDGVQNVFIDEGDEA